MKDVLLILGMIITVLIPALGVLLAKRFSREDSNEHIAMLREESRNLDSRIIDVLAREGEITSKSHLATIVKKAGDYRTTVESQRKIREELEQKLTTSHTEVIGREAAHQDIKAAKQEDENALQSVLSNYNEISSESISLERRLADSLKTIDTMSAEVALTEDQKAVFDALATSLTSASSQLRDVIVDHQNVYERLTALRSQYVDLEAEYIKLVELQLES